MKTFTRYGKNWVSLMPGESYASDADVVMTTLVGSCVAACIYDPVHQVAGINHFLLSNQRYSKTMHFSQTDAGRYGIQAMELLINSVLRLGGQKRLLQAKAFGGSRVAGSERVSSAYRCVGSVNVDFIKDYLETEGIPLRAASLGGEVGRMVRFYSHDHAVDVKELSQRLVVDEREEKYWASKVKAQETEEMDVEFF